MWKFMILLINYKLGFGVYSPKWHGNMAVGQRSEGADLWGVVWGVTKENMEMLYRQEGVNKGKFRAEKVDVFPPDGSSLSVIVILPEDPPTEGSLPSPAYKQVIVDGAVQCGLPVQYVETLKQMPDNGYKENIDMRGENF